MRVGFLLLLLLGTAFAETHVNISIGQNTPTNPDDVTYLVNENTSADLKVSSQEEQKDYGYSAKLQLAESSGSSDNSNQRQFQRQKSVSGRSSYNSYNSGPAIGRQYTYQQYNQRQQSQSPPPQQLYQQQRQVQSNEHEAQNQEFERYIQKFHTGPTVETVYETSSPAPLRVQQQYRNSAAFTPSQQHQRLVQHPAAAAEKATSSRAHKFERIVAVSTVEPPASSLSSSSSSSPANQQMSQRFIQQQDSSSSSSGGGYAGNYDRSYNAQVANYGQSSVGEYSGTQNSYGSYRPESFTDTYSSGGGSIGSAYSQPSQGPVYPSHPVYQETPVTSPAILQKTIHVAQPALKAKTFEIRRPAIQKQFYDIEERILVKPAGTVVVELDHPVAKIPKGETIVPIGIGGGAGIGGYHHTSAGGSSSGGSNGVYYTSSDNSVGIQQQYNPPVYHSTNQVPPHNQVPGTSTIGSHITTTPISPPKPSVLNSGGTLVVEPKSFGDGQFSTASSTTTERTVSTTVVNNTGYYGSGTATATQGGTQQATPFMVTVGEPDFHYPPYVEINSHSSAINPSESNAANDQSAAAYVSGQQQQQQQREEYNEDSELLTDEFSNESGNQQRKATPARLQASQSDSSSTARVLKQEHNIHVPPAQHTIVLGRLQQQQQQSHSPAKLQQQSARYEETARVQEIKPYLKQHTGPVVVYATASVPVRQRQYQTSAAYTQQEPQRELRPTVQYSPSYSQQRIVPNSAQQVARSSTASPSYFVPEDNQRRVSLAYTQPADSNNYQQRHFVYSQQKPQPVYAHRSSSAVDQTAYQVANPTFKSSRLTASYQTSSSNNDGVSNSEKYHSAKLQAVPSKSARYTSEESSSAQTKIHIQVPLDTPANKPKQIIISSTTAPATGERSGAYKNELQPSAKYTSDPQPQTQFSARYEVAPSASEHEKVLQSETSEAYTNCTTDQQLKQQKFDKLIESDISSGHSASSSSTLDSSATVALRSDSDVAGIAVAGGHGAAPGSRVIAATPAPNDDSGSESFHARRIVVNHPFQTVREVVEHVPVTNYHQVTVNEPHAALYRQYQGNGNTFQQVRAAPGGPVIHSASTHGNLQQNNARYQTEITDHGYVSYY